MLYTLWNSYHMFFIMSFYFFFGSTFILDGFKFSNNKYFRICQWFMFISIFLYLYINYFHISEVFSILEDEIDVSNISNSSNEPVQTNPNIDINNPGSRITLELEPNNVDSPSIRYTTDIPSIEKTVIKVAEGIENLGSNVGLGGAITGTAAVANSIKSSPIPPVAKAGLVIAGGAAGGAIFVAASTLNKVRSEAKEIKVLEEDSTSLSSPSSPSTTGFDAYSINESVITDSSDQISNPVETFLSSILVIQTCSLIFTLILISLLINRYYLGKDFYSNSLDKLFDKNTSNKLKNYFSLFFYYLGKSNTNIIILTIILLLITIITSIYFILELKINFENFSIVYLKYINKN